MRAVPPSVISSSVKVPHPTGIVAPDREKPITLLRDELVVTIKSASAAEIFASAMQDNNRAIVVGVNTYTTANHLADYVGTQIVGGTSGVKARVVGYSVADSEDPDTLFIKYIASGTDYAAQTFSDGENISSDAVLSLQGLDSSDASVTTSFGATNTTAITQATGAVSTGSAVTVTAGVFFVRGMFVQTAAQTLVLDKYTNVPSYRVGFDISET